MEKRAAFVAPLLLLFVTFPWDRAAQGVGASRPCLLRRYGSEKAVCVCNATYCDTIDRVPAINEGEYVAFVSSKHGLRFSKTTDRIISDETKSRLSARVKSTLSKSLKFTVKPSNKYQKIIGFGGAFTDSAGINILSLDKKTQKKLIWSYFSQEGIEYNLCRVPIGGTDFSPRPYSYDDGGEDSEMNNFSLAEEDLNYKVPPPLLIQRITYTIPLIQRASGISSRELRLIAASWSPPPWMKSNHKYGGRSHLKEEFYDAYAKYLLRFLDEYKKRNVDFWAISTGNQPALGVGRFLRMNSLGWTPQTMARWITTFFGPQLRNSTHKDVVLLGLDDLRVYVQLIRPMVKADKNVLKYVDGFAVHWYYEGLTNPRVVNMFQKKYPGKFFLYTEACNGYRQWERNVDIGSWRRGEKYMASIIENINAGVTGWLDWNLALDLTGGPNWANNFVDSPILVNASAGEFYKQPMFYAMGHVAKFIERDAARVQVTPTNVRRVQAMAVENPDGRVVIVMLNKHYRARKVSIKVVGKGLINIKLPPTSFATVLC